MSLGGSAPPPRMMLHVLGGVRPPPQDDAVSSDAPPPWERRAPAPAMFVEISTNMRQLVTLSVRMEV